MGKEYACPECTASQRPTVIEGVEGKFYECHACGYADNKESFIVTKKVEVKGIFCDRCGSERGVSDEPCKCPKKKVEERKCTVPELMAVAGQLYKKKNTDYGDSYKIFGEVLEAIFPNSLCLTTKDDFNKFGVVSMIVTKLIRYANLFGKDANFEPVQDTVTDLGVYAFMLSELEQEEEACSDKKQKET